MKRLHIVLILLGILLISSRNVNEGFTIPIIGITIGKDPEFTSTKVDTEATSEFTAPLKYMIALVFVIGIVMYFKIYKWFDPVYRDMMKSI